MGHTISGLRKRPRQSSMYEPEECKCRTNVGPCLGCFSRRFLLLLLESSHRLKRFRAESRLPQGRTDSTKADPSASVQQRLRSRHPIPPGRSSRWNRQIQSRAVHRDTFTTTRMSSGMCWQASTSSRSAPIDTAPSPEIAYSGRATSLMFGRLSANRLGDF